MPPAGGVWGGKASPKSFAFSGTYRNARQNTRRTCQSLCRTRNRGCSRLQRRLPDDGRPRELFRSFRPRIRGRGEGRNQKQVLQKYAGTGCSEIQTDAWDLHRVMVAVRVDCNDRLWQTGQTACVSGRGFVKQRFDGHDIFKKIMVGQGTQ